MQPHSPPSAPSSIAPPVPTLFWGLLAVCWLCAAVPTLWPGLDLSAAALFFYGQDQTLPALQARDWWWVEGLNAWVPAVFRSFLAVCLLGWLVAQWTTRWAHWRLPLAFVVCAGIVGPGAVVNWGLKENWQRARPYQVEDFGGPQQFSRAAVMTDQCNNNCSFVSGHVACGFFFSSLMLVHAARRRAWMVAGTVGGLVIGFARMANMAHWLSDVLWAYPVTLLSSWLTWRVLCWLYQGGAALNKPERTSG